jgi:hypothetical protein
MHITTKHPRQHKDSESHLPEVGNYLETVERGSLFHPSIGTIFSLSIPQLDTPYIDHDAMR